MKNYENERKNQKIVKKYIKTECYILYDHNTIVIYHDYEYVLVIFVNTGLT